MFLQQIDLTTALRPSLLPDEILLFVQDAVGLYEGKYKLPQYQNGQAYLTSHRACYVDNEEPRSKALAVNLKDVDRCEVYAGFMKSSPKITLYPKAAKHFSLAQRTASIDLGQPSSAGVAGGPGGLNTRSSPAPRIPTSATWICPICSFSNPVPSNFDPSTSNENTPIPPCLACGIKPPYVHVVKAAIASLSNRPTNNIDTRPVLGSGDAKVGQAASAHASSAEPFRCPRCTFKNHPSLLACELCGASLVTNSAHHAMTKAGSLGRAESPGPTRSSPITGSDPAESIKFSFRAGGSNVFHERLKSALIQRKWLLQSAPPPPRASDASQTVSGSSPKPARGFGIAGLERRDQEVRKNNEVIIGNSFEDLSALMASAKEIIQLAETFSKQMNRSSSEDQDNSSDPASLLSQLNLTTTRDMLGSSSTPLYLNELSRQLAEFLTDDTRGILKSEGGIISLVDLWAVFNRARGGVELVSPAEFSEATQLFEKLKLPVRLRKFKSGLMVVQGKDRTDEKTIKALLDWLGQLRQIPPEMEEEEERIAWDWNTFGYGVTALEAAERFGWSVGVANEELEMAEEGGALCREVSAEGIRFWINHFMTSPK